MTTADRKVEKTIYMSGNLTVGLMADYLVSLAYWRAEMTAVDLAEDLVLKMVGS